MSASECRVLQFVRPRGASHDPDLAGSIALALDAARADCERDVDVAIRAIENRGQAASQRAEAARTLAALGHPRAVPPLLHTLEDADGRNAELVEACVRALVRLNAREAVPRLARLVAAKRVPSGMRAQLILALGSLGDSSTVPMLVEQLQRSDGDAEVQLVLSAMRRIAWMHAGPNGAQLSDWMAWARTFSV